MLTFKRLTWSNCFSYGEQNVIDFNKEPLIQLVGINGSGKTSISLMLQEVLYGKNIKNIKKQDITNNKTDKKGYYISLSFTKNNDEYLVELDRKSNLKFRLYENGEDISSHTSLNTYKTLSEIIGISDFKVFCQLIYQHSTDSLEFLTATDTNRKKFLISLLQLDRYLELHELFKNKGRNLNTDISILNGKIEVIESWIDKHKDMDFIKQNLLTVESMPDTWINRRNKLELNIININKINRVIATNNEYIKQLSKLDSKYYLDSAPSPPNPETIELHSQIRVLQHQYKFHQDKFLKIENTEGECPECFQYINTIEQKRLMDAEIAKRDITKKKIKILQEVLPQAEKIENEIKKYANEKTEFERLNQLIDNTQPIKTLDLIELRKELLELEIEINRADVQRMSVINRNLEISAHNSKVDVVKDQLKEMKKDLLNEDINLAEQENKYNIMELLRKVFSTNGLVSYKIESSVKELEKKINHYLTDISDFQMYFKLSGEKLNLEIFDGKNNQTAIQNLSSGERARLNLASVLAIRNILSTLTNTKINLLFLDEITGSLDAEGKEKFTEILLKENLNTFFVSHEWTHPLVPQINIIKENNISRIEHD